MAHRTEPRHPSPLQLALQTAPLRPCNPAVLCIQARPAEPIHVGGVRYTELAACGLAQQPEGRARSGVRPSGPSSGQLCGLWVIIQR